MNKEMIWISMESQNGDVSIGVFRKREDAVADFFYSIEEWGLDKEEVDSYGDILKIERDHDYILMESRLLM